jgi:hypothetical protein
MGPSIRFVIYFLLMLRERGLAKNSAIWNEVPNKLRWGEVVTQRARRTSKNHIKYFWTARNRRDNTRVLPSCSKTDVKNTKKQEVLGRTDYQLSFDLTRIAHKTTTVTILRSRRTLFIRPLSSNDKRAHRNNLLWYDMDRIIITPLTILPHACVFIAEPPIQRRLRRYWPHDLLVRF